MTTENKLILKPNKNYEREYNRYEKDVKCQVVKGWLFDGLTHRDLDELILGLDREESRGFESNRILLYLGLDEDAKGFYENREVSDVISELESDDSSDYSEIINILKKYEQLAKSDRNGFNAALNQIQKIIYLECRVNIKQIGEYDGIAIKKLSKTDIIKENRPKGKEGEVTHIAITGPQRDMFPFLISYGYFTELEFNSDFKSYFVFKAPTYLNFANLNYLFKKIDKNRLNEDNINEDIYEYIQDLKNTVAKYDSKSENPIETSVSVLRSRKLPRKKEGISDEELKNDRRNDQIELSQKKTDGEEFLLLRKLLFYGDYLIILKRKGEPKYDMYGINKESSNVLSKFSKNFYYDYVSNAKSTAVPPNMFEMFDAEQYIPSECSLNKIFFGAPGTGKSYTLNKDRKERLKVNNNNYERVTFHPDYSYANFVGTYKPTIDEENNQITYKFVPGPFLRILVKALKNPSEPFLLIIEEINRANIYSVFGDIFQLLDRNDENISMYPLDPSEDVKKFLAKNKISYEKIFIPNNMYIWATMNSADQGVFPVDTAFKRRWDFTYIPIDNNEDHDKVQNIELKTITETFKWNIIRKSINNFLLKEGVNEDKLMGPFFIQEDMFNDFNTVFKDKVLMYLYEDAARPIRQEIFNGSKKNYQTLSYFIICKDFDDRGIEIFNEDIINEIRKYEENNNE